MFAVRGSHGQALLSHLRLNSGRLVSLTCFRSASSASRLSADPTKHPRLESTVLEPHGPVAEQLMATGLWRGVPKDRVKARVARPAKDRPSGDQARVNMVSDKLGDDILSYIGPSLKRHHGCDLIDMFPGAGLWSSKLHQFLQPRSHIMLEPDADLYRPFLQPLLDQPGTTLVPKSGIVWHELDSVLTPAYLPHQTIPDDLNARNDTLLVTANLAFHPRKRFMEFESVAALLLHQLVDAIRTGGLFQRYGLVRMLIWTRADDTQGFLPKTIQRRRRQALENDLACEWVREVCGDGNKSGGNWFAREDALNHDSLVATLKRMREERLTLPAGREPEGYFEALGDLQARRRPTVGRNPPTFKRAYHDALTDLQAADIKQGGFDKDSADYKAMKVYKWRVNSDGKKAERLLDLWKLYDRIMTHHKSGKETAKKIAKDEAKWEMEAQGFNRTRVDEWLTYKDNLQACRGDPRLLQWDNRAYEPMMIKAEEFFPNIPCSLLDIQPRAPHPLLRQTGPKSNHAADMYDLIIGTLMGQASQPLAIGLDSLWPGASDYILPRWKSGQDLADRGFLLNLRYLEPALRVLTARQLEELLELWMEWPFRPQYHELIGRTQEFTHDAYEDTPPIEV
ncbi:hypothetical protein F4802DRAFT_394949 [Xylaria palmicola]|nr:hypothetical protein F4802DRAFT_394949 [Xylaria palmicola]